MKQQAWCAGAAAILAIVQGGAAQPPRVWASWGYVGQAEYSNPPPGFVPWTDPRIKIQALTYLPNFSPHLTLEQNAAASADEVIANIHTYGLLGAQDVAVYIAGVGAFGDDHLPRLIYHPLDALSPPYPDGFRTLWMSHGTAETGAWMDAFVARYRFRQQTEAWPIPDPWRFQFDTETYLIVYPWQATYDLYAAMLQDPRATTEAVPGLPAPANTVSNLSGMEGLNYFSGIDPEQKIDGQYTSRAINNQNWINAYTGLTMRVQEAAYDNAVYGKLRAAWPQSRSSNYFSSIRLDGVGDHVLYEGTQAGHDWHHYFWEGLADLQSFPLYPINFYWANPGESGVDAGIRFMRRLIDVCKLSFGGDHSNDLMAYIPLVGQGFSYANQQLAWQFMTKRDIRDFLALGRGRNIQEYVIWLDSAQIQVDTYKHWAAAGQLIDEVWGASVTQYAITLGTQMSHASQASLNTAQEGTPLRMQAADAGGTSLCVELAFDSSFYRPECGGTGRAPYLDVLLEGTANTACDVTVYLQRPDAPETWDSAGVVSFGASPDVLHAHLRDIRNLTHGGSLYVSDGGDCGSTPLVPRGQCHVRALFTARPVHEQIVFPPGDDRLGVALDLAQLVKVTALACPADFDGDETLTIDDVNRFNEAYTAAVTSASHSLPDGLLRADFNHDGAVNMADWNAFQAAYAAGCP